MSVMLTETANSSLVANPTNTDQADQIPAINNLDNSYNDAINEPDVIFDEQQISTPIVPGEDQVNNDENSENLDTNKDDENLAKQKFDYSYSDANKKQEREILIAPQTSKTAIDQADVRTLNQDDQMDNQVGEVVLLDSEEETEFDIIDGIMFLNFQTKDELNQFTMKDEKLRNNNVNDVRKIKSRKTRTSTVTSTKKKVASSTFVRNKAQDSAFECSELDDYLSQRNRTKFEDNLEEKSPISSPPANSECKQQQSTQTTKSSNRRKSVQQPYSEDLYHFNNNRSFIDHYESDSSFGSTNTQRKSSNKLPAANSLIGRQSGKSGKQTKKAPPELILTNPTMSELVDDDELDSAYLKCVELVMSSQNAVFNKIKERSRPVYLHQQHVCRTVLSALHPNVLQVHKVTENTNVSTALQSEFDDNLVNNSLHASSIDNTISIKKDLSKISSAVNKKCKDLLNNSNIINGLKLPPAATITAAENVNLNNVQSTLENTSTKTVTSTTSKQSKVPLFKIDPDEDGYLADLAKTKGEPLDVDKVARQKKARNDYEEEGYDIARIISKHTKRDIRLPVRYHESLVGTQWILPNFAENKTRIVNTGPGKKQSTPKLNKRATSKSSLKSPELTSDSLNNSRNVNYVETSSLNHSSQFGNLGESFDDASNCTADDLMTEDEDNAANNMLIGQSSEVNGDTSTISAHVNSRNRINSSTKEQRLVMLRASYRRLFYANHPERIEDDLKRGIKPRVNKLDVLNESKQTISSLKEQQKGYSSAFTFLDSWNNRLKLCIKEIEQSNGNLNSKKIEEFEHMLNNYRTKAMNKVNQLISTAGDHLKQNTSTSKTLNATVTTQSSLQKPRTNQLVNGFNRLDATGFIFNKNTITINPSKPLPPPASANHSFNCQSNVAFLDNTNGVSRVMNLKPKKSITIQHNVSRPTSSIASNINLKQELNGITINANGSVGIPRNKINASTRLIKSKSTSQMMNPQQTKFNNSLLNKNQMNANNNRNYMQFNNVNLMSSAPGNGFLFKITGGGLAQMPYCAPTAEVVPLANTQPTNQLNHHLSLPNSLAPNHSPFVNKPVYFLKSNEITTSHHSNLSISDSLTSSSLNTLTSTSQQQPTIVRNYPKILPKFSGSNIAASNNMVKVTTPISFIPNIQLIPTTHNLVISPINPISTSTATCQQVRTVCPPSRPSASVIAIHSNPMASNKSTANETSLKLVMNGETAAPKPSSTKNSMKIIPKFDMTVKVCKEVGLSQH